MTKLQAQGLSEKEAFLAAAGFNMTMIKAGKDGQATLLEGTLDLAINGVTAPELAKIMAKGMNSKEAFLAAIGINLKGIREGKKLGRSEEHTSELQSH